MPHGHGGRHGGARHGHAGVHHAASHAIGGGHTPVNTVHHIGSHHGLTIGSHHGLYHHGLASHHGLGTHHCAMCHSIHPAAGVCHHRHRGGGGGFLLCAGSAAVGAAAIGAAAIGTAEAQPPLPPPAPTAQMTAPAGPVPASAVVVGGVSMQETSTPLTVESSCCVVQ